MRQLEGERGSVGEEEDEGANSAGIMSSQVELLVWSDDCQKL